MKNENDIPRVRLDKWLWAARFFKTRNLAKQAIEGGHVHCDGCRVKPSKDVVIGDELHIQQGWDNKIVTVAGLSSQRGPASAAQLLYRESQESIEARQLAAERRRMTGGPATTKRPDKKQRRQIHRFKQEGG